MSKEVENLVTMLSFMCEGERERGRKKEMDNQGSGKEYRDIVSGLKLEHFFKVELTQVLR